MSKIFDAKICDSFSRMFLNAQNAQECMSNIFFVIPAFNEQDRVGLVVRSLRSAGWMNVVVVDDGSKDNTSRSALDAGAILLQHVINRGQGAALQTGTEYALSKGADAIVHFDADGQHRIEDIAPMLAPVELHEVDVTFGSRFLSKQHLPFKRRILLKGSVLVLLLFYGMRMTDAHNGFRVLSRKAAEKVRITQDKMAHASEIVELVKHHGLRYKEIPVIICYTNETLRRGAGSFKGACKILWHMITKKVKT